MSRVYCYYGCAQDDCVHSSAVPLKQAPGESMLRNVAQDLFTVLRAVGSAMEHSGTCASLSCQWNGIGYAYCKCDCMMAQIQDAVEKAERWGLR